MKTYLFKLYPDTNIPPSTGSHRKDAQKCDNTSLNPLHYCIFLNWRYWKITSYSSILITVLFLILLENSFPLL